MTAKRRRIVRLPRLKISAEVLEAFREIKKLEKQCSCQPLASGVDHWKQGECPACQQWWTLQTIIHRALGLPPNFWPCLREPPRRDGGQVYSSPAAIALYEELEAALVA
jgi:hypothetical protein